MKIEIWSLDRIQPCLTNPRVIPASAVEKVATAIKEFGWRQPIVVEPEPNLGVIVVGHTRLLAAHKLGLTEAPVHVASGLTPEQIRAYRIADNRVGEEALWNEEALAAELGELRDLGFRLDLTGFDFSELDNFLTAPIDFPSPPESVQENREELEQIKQQRRAGNDATASKNDTERYLVIVYGSREAREAALEKLNLPKDERYVAAESVELRPKIGSTIAKAKFSGPHSGVAGLRKSGAGG